MTSIVGRQNRSAIGSLVERKSRYTRLVHLPMVMTPTTSTTARVVSRLGRCQKGPGGARRISPLSLSKSRFTGRGKTWSRAGVATPFSAYPIRNGKWDWACMGFHSSTDERALLFVFRLLDAEDVFSVKLPVGWQTSRAAVCSGEAKVTTEENVVTVQIPERMRSCVVEL